MTVDIRTEKPSDRELVLTCTFDAPPEKVYRAWTEPELLKRWFAPRPVATPVAELDVRPGGATVRRGRRDPLIPLTVSTRPGTAVMHSGLVGRARRAGATG